MRRSRGWPRRDRSAGLATALFATTEDTTLKEGNNQPNGAGPTIHLAAQSVGLVRFAQPNLAISVTGIASTTLALSIASVGQGWGNNGREIAVHRLTQPWTEVAATWKCPVDTNPANSSADCEPGWNPGPPAAPRPNPWVASPTATALITGDLTGDVVFDVTADEAFFFAHPEQNFGWVIRQAAIGGGSIDFASRESGAPAVLTVTSNAPNPIDPWGPYYTGAPRMPSCGPGCVAPPISVPGTVIDGRFHLSFSRYARQYAGFNAPNGLRAYYDTQLSCSGSAPILPLAP